MVKGWLDTRATNLLVPSVHGMGLSPAAWVEGWPTEAAGLQAEFRVSGRVADKAAWVQATGLGGKTEWRGCKAQP